jgi:choline dehydrogenase
MKESWDYIVVGGGSAGAVVAARLSEDQSVSVLLVEAGLSGVAPTIQIPNLIHLRKRSPRYHWNFPVEPDPTRCNRPETLECGLGLGGGSSVNGMVFLKGLQTDYAAWAATAGPEWSPNAVAATFRKVERSIPVRVPSPLHPIARLFLDSAHSHGFPENSTELLETMVGAMPCPNTAANGWRQSTAHTFLRAARGRPNLKILTRTIARRLILQSGRARSVVVTRAGRTETLHANAGIILSAGAINTPVLLMRSGIGPADHLKAHDITPVADLPEVGRGLQDHPCVWITTRVGQKTWNDILKPSGLVLAGLQWLVTRSGPAASGLVHVTLFGSSKDSHTPDYQMCFVPAGYLVGASNQEILTTSSVTTAVSLCRPSGRGSVRLRPGDTHGAPVVNYRLLEGNEDVMTMVAACRTLREIYNTKPISGSILAEVSPGQQIQSDAQWETHIRQQAVNMSHPTGTCRMGTDAASVVDPRLRVRGVDGLHIADASVMPQITSGNTNAPSIMIGEKAVEFIAADRSPKPRNEILEQTA